MIVWGFYIIDYGAVKDNPIDEFDEGVPRLFWTSPEKAQSVAEQEINARFDATALFEENEDGTPYADCEPKPVIVWRIMPSGGSRTFEWGQRAEYGFIATVFSATVVRTSSDMKNT